MTENNNKDIKSEEKKYIHAKTKKRNWVFILYPESAPENWREILSLTGLEIAISPLHDKDINPGSDEPKKPHYHIILCYEGPTTGNAVKSLVDSLNQPIPLPLDSIKGMYRYFTHKDNPEKYQYDERDIIALNGFDMLNFADLSASDKAKIKLELTKFIKESGLYEYCDFIDKVVDLDKPDYFLIASTNTIYFNTYLRSVRHKVLNLMESGNIVLVDKETGEVLSDSAK